MTVRVFRYSLVPVVLGMLAVAACGVRATSQTTVPAAQPPASTPLSATNRSGWTVSARAQTLGTGQTVVTVSVTVKGPATVYGGCTSPVSAEFIGADGRPAATPSRAGFHCLAITDIGIPAGQSQTFSLQLPTPSGAGPFLIRTTVNSRPSTQLPDLKFG